MRHAMNKDGPVFEVERGYNPQTKEYSKTHLVPLHDQSLYFDFFFAPSNPARVLFLLENDFETVLTVFLALTLSPDFLSFACLTRAARFVFRLATLALMVEETVSLRSALQEYTLMRIMTLTA